jgi:hypothetical protein
MGRKRQENTEVRRRGRPRKVPMAAAAAPMVIEGLAEVVRLPTKVSAGERKLAEFYGKYPQVVPGSVREPTTADTKAVTHCHGKVCTVRCLDCGTERTVNLQDAFQSQRCQTCKAASVKARRQERRAARDAKRAS